MFMYLFFPSEIRLRLKTQRAVNRVLTSTKAQQSNLTKLQHISQTHNYQFPKCTKCVYPWTIPWENGENVEIGPSYNVKEKGNNFLDSTPDADLQQNWSDSSLDRSTSSPTVSSEIRGNPFSCFCVILFTNKHKNKRITCSEDFLEKSFCGCAFLSQKWVVMVTPIVHKHGMSEELGSGCV